MAAGLVYLLLVPLLIVGVVLLIAGGLTLKNNRPVGITLLAIGAVLAAIPVGSAVYYVLAMGLVRY